MLRETDRTTGLTRLKWFGVAVPAVLLGTAAVIAHLIYPDVLDTPIGLGMTVAVVAIAAFVFSQVMFALVERLEQRIVDQNRELAARSTIAETLNRPLELDEALQLSLEAIMDLSSAAAGVICILDVESQELRNAAHKGLSPAVVEEVRRQKLADSPFDAELVRTGEAIVIGNAFEDPRTAEVCEREGFRSTAGVPIKSQGKVVGVMGVLSYEEGAFSEVEVHMLTAIGAQVGVAIEKATIFRELTQRNRDLAFLNDLSEALSSTLELDEVLDIAAKRVVEAGQARRVEIWLLEAARHTWGRAADIGGESGPLDAMPVAGGDLGLCRVVEAGATFFPNSQSQRFAPPCAANLHGHSVLGCLPLKAGAELVGVLRLLGDADRPLLDRERQVLHAAAGQIGVAVQNAQLYNQVQDLSIQEERDRIAREMHDGLAQVLGYVNTKAFSVRKLLARGQTSDAEQYLSELEEVARDVYADVREGVLGLRTTVDSDVGLLTSLDDYLVKYSRQSNVEVKCHATDGVADLRLPTSVEIQVIRIIQEALSNVRKHARAKEAKVTLSREDGPLTISIEDSGCGFDADSVARGEWPRFGLQTMRERAESVRGTFEIESTFGRGTKVSVTIPLDDNRKPNRPR